VKRRTLAGRVALVQTALTFLALAAVIGGTSLAVSMLLRSNRDHALNETMTRAVELVENSGAYAQDAEWMERELSEIRPSEIRIELRDARGFVLAESGPELPVPESALGCNERESVRTCAAKVGIFHVVTSVDRTPDFETRNRLLLALASVAAAAAFLVALVSRRVAKGALGPLTDLTHRIARIEPGTGARLGPAIDLEELELLRARFDDLVARFDEAFARERRLTAHASHELRTPLGVARAEIEALSSAEDPTESRQRALAALDRLSQLVDALLWFARAQERLDDDRTGIVNLADVVRAQVAGRAPETPSRDIACKLPDEVLVRGDERLLDRVAANLLDNALKYGNGERIDISAESTGSVVSLRVQNAGAAPSATSAERLFEPFYRGADPSVPGFGLGLPFARAVARAHGGNLEVRPDDPDVTVFTLTLPLVHWSEDSTLR
jgi:signal transduction histidine kinase